MDEEKRGIFSLLFSLAICEEAERCSGEMWIRRALGTWKNENAGNVKKEGRGMGGYVPLFFNILCTYRVTKSECGTWEKKMLENVLKIRFRF